MDRVILHSDLNNFYASVECMENPQLRDKCVAVCGDSDLRHGIVLAKNQLAKSYGVKTGEPVWQAEQRCPKLTVVKPHFEKYLQISRCVRDIYCDYTDKIEPFGIDECWLDVTGSLRLFGGVENIVNEISRRVFEELGVTVSIGVSFNKIFAKLGSDMKKPNGITYITRENFKEKIWQLPADELLMVGKATMAKLYKYNLRTIGALANADRAELVEKFGKWGAVLQDYAAGREDSPVMDYGYKYDIKSIGNSSTAPKDLTTMEEVTALMQVLSESVAARLRKHDLRCSGLQITVRDPALNFTERQMQLPFVTNISSVIVSHALALFRQYFDITQTPVRLLGVRAIGLTDEPPQLTLLDDAEAIEKRERLDVAIDLIRQRYGHDAIIRGCVLHDDDTITLNPGEDNLVFASNKTT